MKRLALICVLAAVWPLAAQQKPATPPAPSVPALQAQLAQKDLAIAQLTAQVHALQLTVQLYEASLGVTKQRSDDQQAIDKAQQAARAAAQTAAAPAKK